MAWLNATPEGKKVPRRVEFQLREKKGEEVPELEPPEVEFQLEYLTGYLFEVGPVGNDGPLEWAEISKWCELTGAVLDSFEALAIKRMSQAFWNMQHEAQKPLCPNPAAEDGAIEQTDAQKQEVNEQARKVFTAMAETGQRKGLGTAAKGARKK